MCSYVLLCLQPVGDESCAKQVHICGQQRGIFTVTCRFLSAVFGKDILPNGHTTLLRRRYNVDTTSRRDIDVVSTSKQRSVPIGLLNSA